MRAAPAKKPIRDAAKLATRTKESAMSLTDPQKKTAQAIVNIFETGKPVGDYGNVTLMAGDSGHLTYGRSQTTLASGNLFLLVKDYCGAAGAALAGELAPYLDRLERADLSLDHDANLKSALRRAGEDPVMHAVQDRFFDRVYFAPSQAACEALGVATALGAAVVYDSHIHGSWGRMRDRANEQIGACATVGEKAWIEGYAKVRRSWLLNHSNTLLRRTVYRMDAFIRLIGEKNWDLDLPLYVRGIRIDEDTIDGARPARVTATDAPPPRLLSQKNPAMTGPDVKALQEALIAAGAAISADGVFGPNTHRAVCDFQRSKGLVVDGIVGPTTRTYLGM